MQKRTAKPKPKVEEVKKPYLTGGWHGQDAWRLAGKRALALLAISVIYLVAGMMLSFDSLIGRILPSVFIVAAVAYYEFAQGMTRGQSDTAFAEIMYERDQSHKDVSQTDRERCFHPLKGYFAALVGAAPFVLFTLVFACVTKQETYQLGVLPSWTEGLMRQNEFGDALRYYGQNTGFGAVDIARIIDRACVMPFINVAAYIGSDASLLVERLSPILVLIAPIWYGVGYARGPKARARINTGIKMGDERKKKRERKERKRRQQSRAPERLI